MALVAEFGTGEVYIEDLGVGDTVRLYAEEDYNYKLTVMDTQGQYPLCELWQSYILYNQNKALRVDRIGPFNVRLEGCLEDSLHETDMASWYRHLTVQENGGANCQIGRTSGVLCLNGLVVVSFNRVVGRSVKNVRKILYPSVYAIAIDRNSSNDQGIPSHIFI